MKVLTSHNLECDVLQPSRYTIEYGSNIRRPFVNNSTNSENPMFRIKLKIPPKFEYEDSFCTSITTLSHNWIVHSVRYVALLNRIMNINVLEII